MRELGWPKTSIEAAAVGGVGVVMTPTGPGIVLKYKDSRQGCGWWIGRIDHGVTVVPDSRVKFAWSVPE